MTVLIPVPVLLITGPVGVGKTTVAHEAGTLLAAAGIPHAVVDLDAFACLSPSPPDDRHNTRIALKNLAAVWANYAPAGAERLVLARVIESRDELQPLRDAVPGADMAVVRLRATHDVLTARVSGREVGSSRARHLYRTIELAEQMERDRVEDHVVETSGRGVVDIAREVLQRAGWL